MTPLRKEIYVCPIRGIDKFMTTPTNKPQAKSSETTLPLLFFFLPLSSCPSSSTVMLPDNLLRIFYFETLYATLFLMLSHWSCFFSSREVFFLWAGVLVGITQTSMAGRDQKAIRISGTWRKAILLVNYMQLHARITQNSKKNYRKNVAERLNHLTS